MKQMPTTRRTVGDIVGDETDATPEPVKPSAWFAAKTEEKRVFSK